MYVQCIAPFGSHAVGDVTEIPDGSEVSPYWFVACNADGSPLAPDDGSGLPPSA